MKKDFPAMLHPFTINKTMLIFLLSMIPLLAMGIYRYGIHVLWMYLVATGVSGLIEVIFAKVRKKRFDVSILVTPTIFTLLLPPTLPLWIVGVGAGFGTFFAKSIFGGFGKNIFNAAIAGRLFITISFPAYMATMWLDPRADVVTTATPLGTLNAGNPFDYKTMDLLLANVPGTVGETFRLGILIIGVILIILKIVNWRIPLAFISSVFIITLIGNVIAPQTFEDPVKSLLVGGLLFAAFFVATDPITSPYTQKGRILFGIGLGIITVVIRNFAAFPEGIMFAIIIMNALAPQLDQVGSQKLRKAGDPL